MVLRIYEQMTVPGDKVKESAMVKERGSDVEREVDILLQRRIFATDLRIAVECRGRKDKDDIKWIDDLIGKYRDLDINKVIAVSKSGFTPAAKQKAAANRIDSLTLERALETNWPAEFTRLGIGKLTRSDKPHSLRVVTDTMPPFPLTLKTMVFTTNGQEVATIERVAKAIYEKRQHDISRAIGEKLPDFFKTVQDVNTKSVLSEVTNKPASPTFIKGEDDQQYRIESVTLWMHSSFSFERVSAEHYILGEAQVSLATIEAEKDAFSVMTVQVSDKPKEAKIHVTLVKHTKAIEAGNQKKRKKNSA